jgi:hypothetical protein
MEGGGARGEAFTQPRICPNFSFTSFFFRLWVHQYGRDGCTNYIHNLAAGHILYFMREYGYLSKYSQQSHEAANAMMTSFFHRTQLGVFVFVSQERSKLKPLARWFRRRLIWLYGIGHKVFGKNCDQDIERFCFKENSIIVALMVTLVTMVSAAKLM